VAAIGVTASVAIGAIDVQAKLRAPASSVAPYTAIGVIPNLAGSRPSQVGSSGAASLSPLPTSVRDVSQLAVALDAVVATAGGASVGMTLVELGGTDPVGWSVNGGEVFTAASTYKLAALMLEAENLAEGKTDPNGVVCFQSDDYESGWFDDYGNSGIYDANRESIGSDPDALQAGMRLRIP